jgi:hypothetical protein
MDRTCSRTGRDNKYVKNLLEYPNGRYFLEGSGLELKIILKLLLIAQDGRC